MKRIILPEGKLTRDCANEIDQILLAYGNDETKLIEILLSIQEVVELHYIPKMVAFYVAEKLNIKITQIYDVISFYAGLCSTPRAQFPIQICDSAPCRVNDSDILYETLRDILGIDVGEVTYDHRFTLEKVPCFGACDVSPAVRVNGKVYGHLSTREKVVNMISELMKGVDSNG
jgi:NADH:ubiquinone oxidoreductase subunit E